MVLGDVTRVRRLAGNPAVANVSDADITQGLTFGTAQVKGITGKTDWETDTTHTDYAVAVTAAEYYASSYIRDRFNDQGDISSEHIGRAYNMTRQIADRLANSPGYGTAIAMRKYRSYPLNGSAIAYRSMLGAGQELVGIGVYEIP